MRFTPVMTLRTTKETTVRPDGIYWNSESEVWVLFKDGELVVVSVMKDDCVDAAIALKMTLETNH